MMYRNYRHKNKLKFITSKISYIIGFIFVLFLFIWKMPVKQTEIVRDIKIENVTLR